MLQARGWSPLRLADEVGVCLQTVTRALSHKGDVSLVVVMRIARALHCTPNDLLMQPGWQMFDGGMPPTNATPAPAAVAA